VVARAGAEGSELARLWMRWARMRGTVRVAWLWSRGGGMIGRDRRGRMVVERKMKRRLGLLRLLCGS
jgi:hypothetical protein